MSASTDTLLRMFRSGMDTYDIAKKLNWPEAKVSRLLYVARCRELKLPAMEYRAGRIKPIAA